jgi:[ribosomal protein S18]-alanine N-acetyltransferase
MQRFAPSSPPRERFRRRTRADLGACVGLMAEVHRVDGYPSPWPDDPVAWLVRPDLAGAWVVELETGVAGHVALTQSGLVTRLMVAPWARRRGLAVRLLGVAAARADALALRPSLQVVDTRSAAIAVYESAGWSYTGACVDVRGRRLLRYAASARIPSAPASSPRDEIPSLR